MQSRSEELKTINALSRLQTSAAACPVKPVLAPVSLGSAVKYRQAVDFQRIATVNRSPYTLHRTPVPYSGGVIPKSLILYSSVL